MPPYLPIPAEQLILSLLSDLTLASCYYHYVGWQVAVVTLLGLNDNDLGSIANKKSFKIKSNKI
jgi:hypothetical protein